MIHVMIPHSLYLKFNVKAKFERLNTTIELSMDILGVSLRFIRFGFIGHFRPYFRDSWAANVRSLMSYLCADC